MTPPFRALLLAAGLGTRLRPITKQLPKCLVEVAGEPLLNRWLCQLEGIGCESVLINTHYLSAQVERFLNERPETDMQINTVYETELLGTAGTLLANQSFFHGSSGLLIHADNVMDGNLQDLLKSHISRPSECLLTILTFHTDQPHSCGIVVTDEYGIMRQFHEKVSDPPGNCANGAIYCFDSDFISYCCAMRPLPTDLSIEVIPSLVGRVNTWHTSKNYFDIGTPSALEKARRLIVPLGGI